MIKINLTIYFSFDLTAFNHDVKMKQLFFFVLLAAGLLEACNGGGEKTTPNGYKIINHTNVSGPKAQIGEYAYVHVYAYKDDSLLNSSREYGRTVPVIVPDFSTIPKEERGPGKSNPLADAVGFMAVGDSVSLVVPIDDEIRQTPFLKDAKRLSYDIVLVEIKTQAQYQEAQAAERAAANAKKDALMAQESEIGEMMKDMAAKYKAGELKSQLKATGSGLKYIIIEEGTGNAPAAQQKVEVSYYGVLTNGEMFDNSFMRGTTFPFSLGMGQVIAGWDEGIALLKEGSKAVQFIPSNLAYGANAAG